MDYAGLSNFPMLSQYFVLMSPSLPCSRTMIIVWDLAPRQDVLLPILLELHNPHR